MTFLADMFAKGGGTQIVRDIAYQEGVDYMYVKKTFFCPICGPLRGGGGLRV